MPLPTREIRINLDPNGVSNAVKRVAVEAAQVVAACIERLATGELSEPSIGGSSGMGYRFSGDPLTSDQRRAAYNNWLLAKGFGDLARGIRECLEEAVLFITLLNRPPGLTTEADFESELATIRRRANRPNFPDLLAQVNSTLTAPLSFDAEFLSMQKARNCLEHRGGVVGSLDLDTGGSIMTLTFPRLKTFYLRGLVEIELQPGMAVDAGDGSEFVQVMIRRETRTRTFRQGDRINLSVDDFAEIALACHFFGDDLASKLPFAPAAETVSA